jgi:glycosyltransferase 2 family protein
VVERPRHPIQTALSLILAAGLLALFLLHVPLADVWKRIRQMHALPLLAAVGLSIANIFVRAARWHWILKPVRKIRLRPLFDATAIGFAASTLLPVRAGEVIRPLVLSRRTGIPFSAALASVVFERIVDMATILFFFALYAFVPALHPRMLSLESAHEFLLLKRFGVAAAAILALLLLLAAMTVARRMAVEGWIGRLARLAPERLRPRLTAASAAFLDGFAVLRDAPALAGTAVGSIVLWGTVYAMIALLYAAFSLPLPFSSTFVVLAITVVGLLLPTPGGVGGFHKACQLALRMFGVGEAAATGLAIVYHLVAFVPVTLIGIALFALGPGREESFARLAAEAEAAEKKALASPSATNRP